MTHTLAGDRETEYDFVRRHLPVGESQVFDLGPGPGAPMARLAIEQGYTVVAVDLEPVDYEHPDFVFYETDFLELDLEESFDWVLNVSTVEHFGLAGRYGVQIDDPDADLRAMTKLQSLLKPDGRMILTIPVGQDRVIKPWHRVYGVTRLPGLLTGYRVLEQAFWAKTDEIDNYHPVAESTALATIPTVNPHYYALGGFILERTR